MAEWYVRFGDIPGVEYSMPPGIDARRLPGFGLTPEVQRLVFDGVERVSLSWPTRDGTTGQSPAAGHAISEQELDGAGTLRNLAESLELPGDPSDYHFAIQQILGRLWHLSKDDPGLLSDLERLAWLDLSLTRAEPAFFYSDRDGTRQWYRFTGLGLLIRMYEREGAWNEALEVARIAYNEFGQEPKKFADLSERVAALHAEVP